MPAKSSQATFKVHPGIFTILGEQLVSDAPRALAELVKNAYDADATEVAIALRKKPNGESELIVEDNGHGMTRRELVEGWLQIAAPNKREKHLSPRGRHLSGSMGIGRLALFSLAERVHLLTGTTRRSWLETNLNANWFRRAPSLISVKLEVKTASAPPRTRGARETRMTSPATAGDDCGTVLRLTKLKWWPKDEAEVAALRRRLAMIQGPKEKSEFRIALEINGAPIEISPEEELADSPYTITATVDARGQAVYKVVANAALYVGKSRPAVTVWSRREEGGRYPELAGVTLRAYWMPRGARGGGTEYWSSEAVSADGPTGVRVYRDGIRVMPYGDEKNDWLNLEARYVGRGAMSRTPRRDQVVGWISISRITNPELRDTANRDGLIQNDAYGRLVAIAQGAMDLLSEARRVLEPTTRPSKEANAPPVSQALKATQDLKKTVGADAKSAEQLDLIETVLRAAAGDQELLALYRDRLTAGNLLRLVLHDAGASLRPAQSLFRKAAGEGCDVSSHMSALPVMDDLAGRILGGYDLLRGAGRSGAYRKSPVDVTQVASKLLDRFEAATTLQVTINRHIQNVRANIRESDLWAILINLVHNALTSGEFRHGGLRTFPQQRIVDVTVRTDERDLVIECDDNGPGLPDVSEAGWVWKQFQSTRKDGGSGLGLWIVADATKTYGGTYEAGKSHRYASGASFVIRLPGVCHND